MSKRYLIRVTKNGNTICDIRISSTGKEATGVLIYSDMPESPANGKVRANSLVSHALTFLGIPCTALSAPDPDCQSLFTFETEPCLHPKRLTRRYKFEIISQSDLFIGTYRNAVVLNWREKTARLLKFVSFGHAETISRVEQKYGITLKPSDDPDEFFIYG